MRNLENGCYDWLWLNGGTTLHSIQQLELHLVMLFYGQSSSNNLFFSGVKVMVSKPQF